jgi:formylglycine-generating enzyme required for sulfatase activity
MNSHRVSSRNSILWRSDLVRTEIVSNLSKNNLAFYAKMIERIGFLPPELELEERFPLDLEKFQKDLLDTSHSEEGPDPEEPVKPEVELDHWLATRFSSPPWPIEPPKRFSSDTEGTNANSSSGDQFTPVPVRYLATWPQLRTRLEPLLQRQVITRKTDDRKLIQLISRCVPIDRLPRKTRKKSPEQLHVVLDSSKRCDTYMEDQEFVVRRLQRELPKNTCIILRGRNPDALMPYEDHPLLKFGREYRLIGASDLLILGDLGFLESNPARNPDRKWWIQRCKELHGSGCRIFALLPFATDQVPESLRQVLAPVAWQGNDVRYLEEPERSLLIERMFVAAYPAMRIEPQLLRELRSIWPEAQDASLESSFWQHEFLADNHVNAAKNDLLDKEKLFKDRFEALDETTRRRILETIRRYRFASDFVPFWYMEFLNLSDRTRILTHEHAQDLQAMRKLVDQYRNDFDQRRLKLGLRDHLGWFIRRVTEEVFRVDGNVAANIRHFQRELVPDQQPHSSTRLSELVADGEQRVSFIEGNQGEVRLRSRGTDPVDSASVLPLRSTSRLIEVHVPRGAISPERAFWKSGVKPQWVSDYGSDIYGLWCEFQVPRHDGKGMVTQRMRWIKPGEFLMGSPEGEVGRFEDESPAHLVKLTQGYWMADTQVTQELWMAFGRGENPSKFNGESNPVENVSWTDCQAWFEKLREHHESLQLALPTEAQWEHACRAGSTSAFCFGDDPRELPKYGWFRENSERKTHPVKQLQPNGWGLYDLHGNVWEWCSDWYGKYASSVQSDPTGPAEGTTRVVRGGSWDAPARYLRSACRPWYAPGLRDDDLGFRLLSSALGAEPSERAMLPVAEQGTERARPVQVRMKDQEPVRTDRFWKSGIKPQWVSDYGSDTYGLWCEFQVPRHDGDGMVAQRMRWIKPGEFLMGSPKGEKGRENDSPQHPVKLTHGYWLADTQVTQELWFCIAGKNPSHLPGDTNPVERISWSECDEWLRRISGTVPALHLALPTEAQWEYACRAGSTSAYCFGDDPTELPKYGWFFGNSKLRPHPVKQLQPNGWGLYDMHGNVWEWCSDWYGKYALSAQSDPTGPAKGTSRVVRGGSGTDPGRDLRSACRSGDDPGNRDINLGFRLLSSALGAEPSERAMLPVAEQGTEGARIGSAEPAYEFLRSVDLDATGDSTPEEEFSEMEVNAYASIRVVSDQEGYQFDRLAKPTWAVDFGGDSYGLYATFEVKPVRQRMRWIPPGRFFMGSQEGRDYERGNEGPQHEVIITHGYWMFDTPCTQGLWTALMGDNPSYFQDPERQVEQVSWVDAVGFAKKLNEQLAKDYPSNARGLIDGWERLQFRLPTEAEWEYACRAGTTGDTYVGDLDLKSRDQTKSEILDSIAWYGGNSGHKCDLEKGMEMTWLDDLQADQKKGGTRKVAQKAPNAWGLYDMVGNVWEWCQDWYGEYPAEPVERVEDPIGPTEGASRVVRGGSWSNRARYLRSAYRSRNAPGSRLNSLGFRLLSSAHRATESGEEV